MNRRKKKEPIKACLTELAENNRLKGAVIHLPEGKRRIIKHRREPITMEFKLLFSDGRGVILNPMKPFIFDYIKGMDDFDINQRR